MVGASDGARVKVNVRALLEFFDEAPDRSLGHATAIVAVGGEELGLALLVHYLNDTGAPAVLLRDKCTPGTRSGSRLDGWISAGDTLYQVEVKNWSAHAIGGRRLAIDASSQECVRYRRWAWRNQWGPTGFKGPGVRKVLEPMRPPQASKRIEPVVVYWTALHPRGAGDPWFRKRTGDTRFKMVNVFSMSNYLRSLRRRFISLSLPKTSARLNWLETLFARD